MYKLVALDIDGTICNRNFPISIRTRNAIVKLMEIGCIVTLATGRIFESALNVATELKIKSPIISSQGSEIRDPKTGITLKRQHLTKKMTLIALEALSTWKHEIIAYHDDNIYANIRTPWVEEYSRRNNRNITIVNDFSVLASKKLIRLVAIGNKHEISSLEQYIKKEFENELRCTRSLENFCEIIHPNSGKDNALAWLSNHLGVPQHKTVAFGNGYDDVQMICWAGLGIAVMDGVKDLIKKSDKIAEPMIEDGVAKILENLINTDMIS